MLYEIKYTDGSRETVQAKSEAEAKKKRKRKDKTIAVITVIAALVQSLLSVFKSK